MGKSTMSMAIFNSYVKLPEGKKKLKKEIKRKPEQTIPRNACEMGNYFSFSGFYRNFRNKKKKPTYLGLSSAGYE
jgi:hypothetical protein